MDKSPEATPMHVQEQAVAARPEELYQSALNHYNELSDKACSWVSSIPQGLRCLFFEYPKLKAELLAERQKVERMEKALRWVSVDEQMPKQGKMVLAYFKNENGYSRRIRAMWAPKFGIVDEGDYQGDSEYDEKTDECYWPEGWYEANEFEETNWLVMEDVTHWMPLPDPPVAALAKETNESDEA